MLTLSRWWLTNLFRIRSTVFLHLWWWRWPLSWSELSYHSWLFSDPLRSCILCYTDTEFEISDGCYFVHFHNNTSADQLYCVILSLLHCFLVHALLRSGTGWTLPLTPGRQRRVWTIIWALCVYPPLSRVFTLTYCTFLPLFSLQSHNEWFHPRTPPLCPCLSSSSPRLRIPLPSPFFFVLSRFIPMLHSNWVIFFFLFLFLFSSTSSPSGPTTAYRDLFGACLYPQSSSLAYGKLQSVICLRVYRDLQFFSLRVLFSLQSTSQCDVWIHGEAVRPGRRCVFVSSSWDHTL